MTEVNCNRENGKNQVFDPFKNTGVAALLDSERKKICGIMGGDDSPEDIDCGVDLERCPYCVLLMGECDQSECALKFVSRVMKGIREEAPALPSDDPEVQHE